MVEKAECAASAAHIGDHPPRRASDGDIWPALPAGEESYRSGRSVSYQRSVSRRQGPGISDLLDLLQLDAAAISCHGDRSAEYGLCLRVDGVYQAIVRDVGQHQVSDASGLRSARGVSSGGVTRTMDTLSVSVCAAGLVKENIYSLDRFGEPRTRARVAAVPDAHAVNLQDTAHCAAVNRQMVHQKREELAAALERRRPTVHESMPLECRSKCLWRAGRGGLEGLQQRADRARLRMDAQAGSFDGLTGRDQPDTTPHQQGVQPARMIRVAMTDEHVLDAERIDASRDQGSYHSQTVAGVKEDRRQRWVGPSHQQAGLIAALIGGAAGPEKDDARSAHNGRIIRCPDSRYEVAAAAWSVGWDQRQQLLPVVDPQHTVDEPIQRVQIVELLNAGCGA